MMLRRNSENAWTALPHAVALDQSSGDREQPVVVVDRRGVPAGIAVPASVEA